MKLSRRSLARLILGAPVAAAVTAAPLQTLFGIRSAAAAEQAVEKAKPEPPPEPEPTPLARFLAREDEDLTSAERKKIRRSVTQLEQSLKEIRGFKMGNEVPPSGTFRALKSKR